MARNIGTSSGSGGFAATFGEQLRAKGFSTPVPSLPTSVQAAPPVPSGQPAQAAQSPSLESAGKLVIRRESKGRGGKSVTVVSGLPVELVATWAQLAKSALGCGATVEGVCVIVQGDQMTRLEALLSKHGARLIVRGN